MSPVDAILLALAGLVLLWLVLFVEPRVYHARREASWRLEVERKAREAAKPCGNVRVYR